jgi:chitinase
MGELQSSYLRHYMISIPPMKKTLLTILVLTCPTLYARAQSSAPHPPSPRNPAVIAYYATKTFDLDSFATDKLTHLIFSFCHLRDNRMIVTGPYDSVIIRRMVDLKNRNPRLKVILSLGGWAGCRTCSSVFSTKKGRRQFTRSVRELTDLFHTDGIDLDWEYPGLSNAPGYPFSPDDKDHFTLLLQRLRKKLPRRAEISFAAGGFTAYLATSVDWKRTAPLVDHINLMTYDLVNGYDTVTGHHTPLYSTPRQHESADQAVRFLDSAGVPLSKLVIGAAFYGRLFEGVDSIDNGLYRPGRFRRSIDYRDLATWLSADSGFVIHRDPVAQAPYIYNAARHLFLTYDDSLSVGLKTKYAMQKGLGGIMFWQLGEDRSRNGLLDAIDDAVKDAANTEKN